MYDCRRFDAVGTLPLYVAGSIALTTARKRCLQMRHRNVRNIGAPQRHDRVRKRVRIRVDVDIVVPVASIVRVSGVRSNTVDMNTVAMGMDRRAREVERKECEC